MQRTIEIDDRQARELEEVARREHVSVDELVRLAVGDYLARRSQDWHAWEAQLDDVVGRFRAGVPAGMTPEQIEAEIGANRAEDRAERAAHRAAEGEQPQDAGAGGR